VICLNTNHLREKSVKNAEIVLQQTRTAALLQRRRGPDFLGDVSPELNAHWWTGGGHTFLLDAEWSAGGGETIGGWLGTGRGLEGEAAGVKEALYYLVHAASFLRTQTEKVIP